MNVNNMQYESKIRHLRELLNNMIDREAETTINFVRIKMRSGEF